MTDKVVSIGKWEKERLDDVYTCPECDSQEWMLTSKGKIKCSTCKAKFDPPPGFLAMCKE